MADELDAMLQGNDPSSVSPAGTAGLQDDSIKPIEQQTEEEVEFNSLSGSAQDRVRELVRRAREAEGRVQPAYVPPAPGLAPDQKQALDTLSNFGVATDEKVDRKINEGINAVRWELAQASLEQKFDGSDGAPKYVKEEVEDYIRSHPQYMGYAAEDVFRYKMFPDEFTNLELEKRGTKPRTSSLRPTKSQQQSPVNNDIDSLMERIDPNKHEDADEYYQAHKDDIEKAIQQHTLGFRGRV